VHPLTKAGMSDSLVNLVTGMGTGKDKSTATTFTFTQMMRDQAEAAYRGDWVSRKIIDIPAFDATREWRTWQTDAADLSAIEDLESKLDIQRKTKAVLQRAALYGGAALILGVDGGDKDTAKPLELEKLGKDCLKFVHVVNRYEITAGETEWDILSPWFGQPKNYTRQLQGAAGQVVLHPSRVIRFVGSEIPDLNQAQGWGDSKLQIVADAVIAMGTVMQSITALINEAKVDVVSIPELSERISSTEYEERLKTRFALAALMKSIYSTLLIDKEEKWERITQVFTGMPEVLQQFMLLVCGAADIPATRFLGQSPMGLNATGDSDTRNYYDRVSTEQRVEVQPLLEPLDTLLQISAFGKAPDGMFYNWNPLWQMTEAEKAEIAVKQAQVMTQDVAAALMDPMVLQKARENQLIESGFYPGIEQIIEEFGTDVSEREAAAAPTATPMIDPETGKAPDPNDPDAMARAIPDPNAPPPAPDNVVPFGKPGAKPPVGKKKTGTDDAIDAMALRIRDAQLIDATTPRTLYIRRDVLNWKDVQKHYKAQGVANLIGAEMHVTVCYSKTPVDWLKVGEDSYGFSSGDEQGRLNIKAGGPRVNEQFGKFLVLAFANSDLSWRHRSILERSGASWDHDDYTPHISISKDPGAIDPLTMPAYTGQIVFGPEVFEEIKVDGADYERVVAPAELATDAMPTPIGHVMPAPIVNVDVHVTPQGKVTKTINYGQDGRPASITETPEE
jgi:phage-related protein (TIGR01555 family)